MATPVIYTIVVYKSAAGVGSKGQFANVHHVLGTDETTEAQLSTTAYNLGFTESRYMGDNVTFTRAIVGTYAKDGVIDGDEGSFPVILAFKGLIGLDDGGYVDGTTIWTGNVAKKVLPAEACLAVAFGGGRGRTGLHSYRFSIADYDYFNDGSGIKISQPCLDRVNNAWLTYLQQKNTDLPLCKPSDSPTGFPAKAITQIAVLGYQNRQLENRRGKKKVDFDIDTNSPNDAEDLVATAVEAIQTVQNQRYSVKGATLMSSGKWAASLAAVATAAAAAKAAIDAHDYGAIQTQ